jgi:two-component system chemotaxis response regulator CheB
MRVMIVDPDARLCDHAAEQLGRLTGVTISGTHVDLTGAFHAVENHPPKVALISPLLIARSEFEMMEMLFRTLRVQWLPLVRHSSALASMRRTRPDKAAAAIDLSADAAAQRAALTAGLTADRPAVPTASSGLLRAVGPSTNRLILIGSSTGGVDALLRVLGGFPPDCPPTLIVQHTGSSFAAGLTRLLDRNLAPTVREARDGDIPTRGTVLLAPGQEAHLTLDLNAGLKCRLRPGDRISGHLPSVDALFNSAVPVARRVCAAILTGMGKDGAEGLLALRKAGAETIGQDKSTSLVYGMPRHAAELGAVTRTLPLSAIGPALLGSALKAAS